MEDLFAIEQKVYDDASVYARELREGAAFEPDKYNELVKEYGRLLRQLRRATKISDRATGTLSTSKVDLQDKVHHDALTGIFNRRYLEDSLKRIVRSTARSGDCLSLMMIDVDHFKKYNDTYGHSAGDTCLKAVAEAISGCLSRADDFAARYGGEEFAVVLPNTDENGARVMAAKMVEAVRALNIPHEKSETTECVTISVGLTTGKAGHEHSEHGGEDFIKRADEALYQSKQNGRNRYTFYELRIEN